MDTDLNNFSFDEKQASKLIKKAKLWSTLKMIVIVVFVTPIVLMFLWYGFMQWSNAQAQKTMNEIVMYNQISSPNVHISNQNYSPGWFGGETDTSTYKIIGNKPYIWEPIERNYNLFSRSSRQYGSFGSIQLDRSDSLAKSHQFYKYNSYTGEREMFFYHPEITYDAYKNSISDLTQIEDTTLVELGLSFDQAYSLNEIQSKLPSDVQVVWWWVDAYTDENLTFMKQDQITIGADSWNIHGFHSEQFAPYGGIDSFITSTEHLRKHSKSYKWYAEQIYTSIAGDNKTLEKSDIKIIGAVVTGTAEQLQVLLGQPYIKASTFGVITNKVDIPN